MRHHQADSDGSLIPVDRRTAVAPSVTRTWFIALLVSGYTKVVKRDGTGAEGDGAEDAEEGEEGEQSGTDSAPGSGTATPKEGRGKRVVAATTMAGGKRRKAVRKR